MAETNFKMTEEDIKEFLYDEGDDIVQGKIDESVTMPEELTEALERAEQQCDEATSLNHQVAEAGGYIQCSKKEKSFIDEYMKNGFNATQAALKTMNCKNAESASTLGSKIVNKFNLQKYKNETIKLRPIDTVTDQSHGKTYAACKDANAGFMTMKQLRQTLESIARYDHNAQAQVSASKVLMEFAFRAKELAQTRSMAGEAIEDVMSKALAQVPKDVYERTLEKAATLRSEFDTKCADKFDEKRVEEITAQAKDDMMRSGVVEIFDPKKDELK